VPAALRAPISTRPAGAGDEAFLFELYAGTRADEMARVPWSAGQREAFLRMQFEAQARAYADAYPEAAFSIVECGGERVGRVTVHASRREIRIVDIAIADAWRGRGIGTAIVRTIFQDADRSGRPVTIHVERDNPARAWYARLGFARIGERGFHDFMERRPATEAACSSASR
jgi:ribosomal protein S18 acetylase RimI-like enzyme